MINAAIHATEPMMIACRPCNVALKFVIKGLVSELHGHINMLCLNLTGVVQHKSQRFLHTLRVGVPVARRHDLADVKLVNLPPFPFMDSPAEIVVASLSSSPSKNLAF